MKSTPERLIESLKDCEALTVENAQLKAELADVKAGYIDDCVDLRNQIILWEKYKVATDAQLATLEREKAEQRDRIAELEKDKANLLQACAHLFDAWNHNLGRLYEAMGTDSPRIESIALAMRQLESEINAAMKKEGALGKLPKDL